VRLRGVKGRCARPAHTLSLHRPSYGGTYLCAVYRNTLISLILYIKPACIHFYTVNHLDTVQLTQLYGFLEKEKMAFFYSQNLATVQLTQLYEY